MAYSTFLISTLLLLAAALTSQPHVRIKDRLARNVLDEDFIPTSGTPQNLCGDSTFGAINNNGPMQDDCKSLAQTVKRNLDGFWMASTFGSDGTAWVELTRLQTCGLEVRRTDGEDGEVPFGDEDVMNLVNSVLTEFSGWDQLPTVQGHMNCSKDDLSAAVEWQICRA